MIAADDTTLATDALLEDPFREDELFSLGGGTTLGRACISWVTVALVVGAKIFDDDFGDEADEDDLSLRPMRGGFLMAAAIAVGLAATTDAKTVSVLMRQPVIVPTVM